MFPTSTNMADTKTTSYKVVLPFYAYGACSFLAATILLLFSSSNVNTHYFTPHNLAIVHGMALGWGTMMILGASHQLVPVMIEGKLYSNILAYLSFAFAAIGIPVLVYGFYTFNMGHFT
ncbi:MAG: cytochrome C oxidase subunit I, partial [Chitinophagaceae bacterium]|nr:cytochrome C oxidase subunit I [Chitinophagaceae bacterium]